MQKGAIMEKLKKLSTNFLIISVFVLCGGINAMQAEQQYHSTTGVDYKLNTDGSLKSIKAKEEAYMTIGDRRDEQSCLKKAELKAKAKITHFLKEEIKSEETFSNIEKTLSDTSAGNSRKIAETITQNISSKAESLLRGVIILESKVLRAQKYCEVTVGMSQKSMNAAQSTQDALNKSFSDTKVGGEPKGSVKEPKSDDSAHRRSPHYNDF